MPDSPYFTVGAVAAYDRLAVPLQFAAPASDLVAGLGLSVGNRVLDVGTGTGAALTPAAAAVGVSGAVVGVDASIEMLRVLRHKCAHPVVLAQATGLPFPEDHFDAVLASFVLSHFKDYQRGLADMVRVLRPKGQLGVTAWVVASNPVAHAWNDVAAAFVNADDLQAAFRELIPWDEWFSAATNLRQALEEAKLVGVGVTRREYMVTMSVTDYLSVKEASVEGTLLRQRLTAAQWNVFTERLADVFRSQFGETVEYVRGVYFGIGTKPAPPALQLS
jgi:SAM-dependent methyltransferase